MLNNSKFKLPLVSVFLCLELALGILVQTAPADAVRWVSFSCVLLACLFCLLFWERSPLFILTQVGLICTVFADVFLVVLEPIIQLPAMVFFSVTQTCYATRLYLCQETQNVRRVHLILRISITLMALLLTVIVLGKGTDALSLVSLFYYANLILNVIFAFTMVKKCPLFALGLLLFLLCDTVIGLNVMADSYITDAQNSFILKLIDVDFNLAWVFYVPSQALISISLIKNERTVRS
ncbi:MAG: hypothetical protein J6B29_02400 [Clostridia bacterium]|nr:hypothetical protein [Clostridia bacterium]